MSIVYIKSNSNFYKTNKYYKKVNSAWTQITEGEFTAYLQGGIVPVFSNQVLPPDTFEIGCPTSVASETCQCVAIFNKDIVSGATWSVVSGSTYATIDSSGLLEILSGASSSSVTIRAEYLGHTDEHDITVTYVSGSTSETTTETVVDASGKTKTTITTVTENEDGTTSSESTAVVYNTDGNPVEKTYEVVDTDSNVSTREIEYDSNGEEIVVGYTIDTTDNPDGVKTFNGDGVNTEYYAFDITRGFVAEMAFTIDCSNNPPGQDDNLHNILTMKRQNPEPWYGFQIRQSSTNKYIQLGTQFSGSTNTNTRINPTQITGNTAEYSLRITYDPTSSGDTFVCEDLLSGTTVFTSKKLFPDIQELKYLKVTLGYAMDPNGEPFRFSNVGFKNFTIEAIKPSIVEPVITCDGSNVTITCETAGSSIFYRLNQHGSFAQYLTPIEITADTVVEAYSMLVGATSDTVVETCIYVPPHDYSEDYLTLRVLTGGTIVWTSLNDTPKTIQYSINNGEWQTTSLSSETINVSADDVIRLKGSNASYAVSNTVYSGFGNSTAYFDVEGNIMSLVYGDNFIGNSALAGTFNFASFFDKANVVSAEHLILPAITLTPHCYRALFANCTTMSVAPKLPATTLAESCYRFMFQYNQITTAPEIRATVLPIDSCHGMFENCRNLNYVKCLATDMSAPSATTQWLNYVASRGTFVRDANAVWPSGSNGIPSSWTIIDEGIKSPAVSFNGYIITLYCSMQGVTIYYRLNETGSYAIYSQPIEISSDTVVEAYSTLSGETSPTIKETCTYDGGVEEPVIYCDGEYITISCETGGASIKYKLTGMSDYLPYEEAVEISADTTCYAYSELDARQSDVVSAECIYDASLKAPEIACDGVEVIITCKSRGAEIYYKLNGEGSFSGYTAPFEISADTLVQAYSELSGETSSIVSENCIYNPTHDYSKDYLTFKVLSGGTIGWKSVGSGQSKAIQYSLNNGTWNTLVADSSVATVAVSTGDVVRFKGTNTSYAKDKSNYSGFEGGSAMFNVEGNIMSLVYGDEFDGQIALTGTYNFCSLFKLAKCVSAENLVLPSSSLTDYCYRAMFSKCTDLVTAPKLPAATLSKGCYWYMFEECAITTAPDLEAETLVAECYGYMFINCRSLNYIKAMALSGFTTSNCKTNWVQNVASVGTFVKDSSVTTSTWSTGNNGIPTNWTVYDDVSVSVPVINCDGYNNVTITCETSGATIYYKLGSDGTYAVYSNAVVISSSTMVYSYAELSGQQSRVTSQYCDYISNVPFEASNRDINNWSYNGQNIETPYSINAIDGHSSSYAKGTFNFESSFGMRQAQPAYLWFQHADQSASIYVDDTLVEKHWGGYAAFTVDISNYVHAGANRIKVAVKNNEGNSLAPASGDFNFNATLGNVRLLTSPCLPSMNYGYDGFHVTSNVTTQSATINVRTTIPSGAVAVCTIDDGTYHYSDTANTTGDEILFTTTIQNPHLWNGLSDPHLYNITLEIYYNGDLYHRYQRPYGLRFYSYVIDDTTVLQSGEPYTGFLLNGSPYLLRGVCMHDDIANKANALNSTDYANTFNVIQELGCNFIRLAHYPHPKEVYDWCDRLGIVVQTEVPCVNKMQSTMPTDYYDHLNGQYDDMVNQHFNHPCIMFWGLSNETTTDDKEFANGKINGYIARIKALDTERMVGYVMAESASDPSAYYNNPNADWFGCNIYQGWYSNKNSNNPSSSINTRIKNIITNKHKALAYSEYGCGGTQHCHSDDFMNTTTRGNYERHDIEYMMWLHEGHIAAIKNYPQLMFTAQWQLFDIAVANRNEGYTVCLDGETTSIDDSLRRLNDKGLVERDHVTKKDPFYLYKAWWNPTSKFVHICGKDYTKKTDRVIKCYSNDGDLSLYVNNAFVETKTLTDNIVEFTSANYNVGDVIRVEGSTTNDTLTF